MLPILLSSSSKLHARQTKRGPCPIDSSFLQRQTHVPSGFIWPEADLVAAHEELNEHLIDLKGFFKGDDVATENAAKLIRASCLNHGFFQVTNHGIDSSLIQLVEDHFDKFFHLPISEKLRVKRVPGSPWGYSGSHADRFSTKLPWKETLSFGFHENGPEKVVVDFFKSKLGNGFEDTGKVYQKYCEAMTSLALSIMELLAISLGVKRSQYREFFKDAHSIMRCNYYPTCQEPKLSLGTGPHCDPTSLTILHQDQVRGLEVFVDNKWQCVKPIRGALVINIGDTFTALSNGLYKSCLHRASVNAVTERRSLAFFLCPKDDNVVKPPEELVTEVGTRKYPDFTWSELLGFTQNHYRCDEFTLHQFFKFIKSESKSVN
ncbi:PREDICTED: gibberellin 20 oxidase 2-like [Fragaria vesca subsp. vesca]|uniref:gibberellin 20 oxidase 2-like n=1 Tax=Fragaria vesca subsp. vesca TaxID=101020 RepID=UPI0002C340A4|nr:PREDICTED: gibberellin 20 oxidase 2-like [Fragaria vesca subsp. vesca]